MEEVGPNSPDTASPAGQHNPVNARTAPQDKTRSAIAPASNLLQDMTKIALYYDNIPKNRRYADLNRNEMFRKLVDLYEIVFKTHWTHFDKIVTRYNNHAAYVNLNERYAAAVYISAWFHDLYISNRLALRKLSDTAYVEHCFIDEVFKSHKYDSFLVTLNSHIRPTVIKYIHEEALFVPRIAERFHSDAVDDDYFNIAHYAINDVLMNNFVFQFEERKILEMEELSENTLGRPSWLFDWQTDGLAYAWFPTEGNYNFEDVAVAYIIGTACTPKLAPRDYDEWRLLPGNVPHNNPAQLNLRRICAISYHGHVEYRVFKTQTRRLDQSYLDFMTLVAHHTGPSGLGKCKQLTAPTSTLALSRVTTGKKAQASQSQAHSAEEEEEETAENMANPDTLTATVGHTTYNISVPVFHEVRIVDYIYHARVINKIDLKSRVAALRTVIYPQK